MKNKNLTTDGTDITDMKFVQPVMIALPIRVISVTRLHPAAAAGRSVVDLFGLRA